MKRILFTTVLLLFTSLLVQGQLYRNGTGVIEDPIGEAAIPVKIYARSKGDLPPQFSVKPYCPKVGNQGAAQSCTGWSIGYSLMTMLEAIRREESDADAIQKMAFSPRFVYDQLTGPKGTMCATGAEVPNILKFVRDTGNILFNEHPIQCSKYTRPTTSIFQSANQHKIHTYSKLWETSLRNPPKDKKERVKKIVANKKPAVVVMKIDESFVNEKFKKVKERQVWTPKKDGYISPHAMIVVGYNDGYEAFELMNSFGADFGNQGFIWIGYKDFEKYCNQAYDIVYKDPAQQYKSVPAAEHPTIPPTETTAAPIVPEWTVFTEFLKVGKRRKEIYRRPMPTTLQDAKGNYSADRIYQSKKSVFQIDIHTDRQQYFYVFSFDTTKTTILQFPFPEAYKEVNGIAKNGKIIPIADVKESLYTLPHKDYGIEFDENSGTDYYCLLFSLKELPIADIQRQIEYGQGTIYQRIQEVLQRELIPTEAIRYFEEGVGFEIVDDIGAKTIVPMIVGIRHL